tara:strand:+ start:9099 stop:10934 length:1836 start_codon:yes stop_codon:yes gene_type:complete
MYNWKTVLITIGVLVGFKIWSPYLVENIKWSYFDVLHQQKGEKLIEDIVLVDIDEKSLDKYGQYPWPRNIYADIMLDSHYTNTHVFTQVFSQPDRFGGDEQFAEGLVNRLSILSAAPTSQKDTGSAPYVKTSVFGGGDIKESIWNFSGMSAPIKVLQDNTYGVGVTVTTPPLPDTPNFDGTVRSAPLIVSANDQIYPSVALETLRAFYDQPNYQTKVTPEVGIEWIRMGRQQPIETTSTSDVMITYWNKFQRVSASELDESYQNKILIWGMTAEGFNNPVSTPYGVMYPHEVQSNLLQTVLSGDRIQNNFLLDFAEIVLVTFLGLLVLLMVYQFPTYLSGIASMTVIGFSVAVSYWIWIEHLILFDALYSALTGLLVFGHASFNKYFVTYKLKEQIKGQFKKYLSPEMVDKLAENPELLKLGGERKEMTFMFMDIIGFTPISEAYKNRDDPEGLVELINKFLDVQTKIIINNNGTIDKYMGDCIMSFWNAPLDCEDHAEFAVKSALEVLQATKELNEELKPLNLPPINVGIGISTGECIVGNMGSEIRFDYSVIGDAVNLGARLEGQTRNYDGVDLLLSERTYQLCPDRTFSEVDRINVKGKSEKVTIYTC